MNPYQKRISHLSKGETIQYRESGNSMSGVIEHRQLITAEPIKDHKDLKVGDVVFCRVRGRFCTHLVHGIRESGGNLEFLIGNNFGHKNGWTNYKKVYGKVVHVES